MTETDPLLKDNTSYETNDEMVLIHQREEKNYFSDVPNFIWIEISLLINVFLSGFDGTITASTYSTIGNEFNAIDIAPWITSSYLITSTAFQPLYGSISDILGRKSCISFALLAFGLGCYGCYSASSMIFLISMRALTGVGGGGLMSLSTITNSDIIYTSKRGMFQAIQNLMLGTGAVCGASFGGILSSVLGWRWCFAIQTLPTLFSFIIAVGFISNKTEPTVLATSKNGLYNRIDFTGAITLVFSLTSQLLILSMGGSELSWLDWKTMGLTALMIASTVIFYKIESTTSSVPIIPLNDYKNTFAIVNIGLNYCIGLASYSYLFTLPLLFQINLGDSVSQAGFRLSIPALATPVGGLIAGIFMAKFDSFANIALFGTLFMAMGNFLALIISSSIPSWATNLLLIPANLGQGLVYPSSLFLFIYYFEPFKQASSTSTVYLMRNIGGVWGVTYISTITQSILRTRLKSHLREFPTLSMEEIDEIIAKIIKSIDILQSFDTEIKQVVIQDYTFALRISQIISGSCCLLAFMFCFIGKRAQSKQN